MWALSRWVPGCCRKHWDWLHPNCVVSSALLWSTHAPQWRMPYLPRAGSGTYTSLRWGYSSPESSFLHEYNSWNKYMRQEIIFILTSTHLKLIHLLFYGTKRMDQRGVWIIVEFSFWKFFYDKCIISSIQTHQYGQVKLSVSIAATVNSNNSQYLLSI